MAKLKSTVYKLQKALILKGRYITINQSQFYSEQMDKMCTKYILKEKQKSDGKEKEVVLFETFRTVEIITFLAELLNGGDWLALNEMQQAFADYYLETSNATDAAKRAGYSEKTAYSQGQRLLKNAEVKAYIDERLSQIKSERIATIDEVLQFYTSVMRGEEKDQFGLDASLADRIKAGKELVSRLAVADSSNNEKANENMVALAELIRNPRENRNIAEFEDVENE